MKSVSATVLGTFVCVFGCQAAFAQDLGATQSETEAERRWVGLTTTITDGSIQVQGGALQGYSAMHAFCASEVAPNARACVTSEIVRSVVEGRRDERGWVIPTSQVLHHDPAAEGGAWFSQDTATGIAGSSVGNASDAHKFLSCGGFLDNQASGIVANASGFLQASCGFRYAIACCAPVAIPVTPSP